MDYNKKPDEDWLVDKKELRHLVIYSPSHIDRLEKAGKFPKRRILGKRRVGWSRREILAWRDRDNPAAV